MHLNNPPLSYYTDMITQGQPFALPRFGDGEWAWILDIPHTTEEGPYSPEIAQELRACLEHNHPYPFHYAMPPLANCHNQETIAAYLERIPGVQWYDCLTIAQANVAGELYPLVEALRGKWLLYVGPEHIRSFVHRNLESVDYLQIPRQNAYSEKAIFLEWARLIIRKGKPDIVGFSAGPLANILIDELWDGTTTLIDFGSIWDPYVGVKSRRYMLNDLSEQMRKNLGER